MTRAPSVLRAALVAGGLALACAGAHAQSVYAGVGTAGLTVGYAHTYGDLLGSRAEVSVLPRAGRSFTENGIDYSGHAQSLRGAALLDWHPLRGGLRLTAGLSAGNSYADYTGAPSAGSTITIGGATVPVGPADQYATQAKLPSAMPYVGLGWGHAPARGWGFHADAGVLVGSATVTGSLSPSLRAKIALTGRDPDAELERELQTVRDAVAKMSVFPVLSLGVSYRW
jgi:hypothetical protein